MSGRPIRVTDSAGHDADLLESGAMAGRAFECYARRPRPEFFLGDLTPAVPRIVAARRSTEPRACRCDSSSSRRSRARIFLYSNAEGDRRTVNFMQHLKNFTRPM